MKLSEAWNRAVVVAPGTFARPPAARGERNAALERYRAVLGHAPEYLTARLETACLL